jgi:hypothetical protein
MTDRDLTEAEYKAIALAEEEIQKILLDLENDHSLRIESVNVDTRSFSNLRTDIFAEPA